MPYAAKATVEHEFVTDHLEIYVTFRHPMKLSSAPLDVPPPLDIMPPLAKWLLDADAVDVDIIASEWLDLWTLFLTSDTIATHPAEVKLEYDGPDPSLRTSWDKQWEPFGPILSTDIIAALHPSFIDRGDPAASDFVVGALTTDGAWHDLDISAIVPSNAKAVLIRMSALTTTAQRVITLKKKGNTNSFNGSRMYTQVVSALITGDFVCPIGTDGLLEYLATNAIWSTLSIVVKGWWL
jgi:hypothetical protein